MTSSLAGVCQLRGAKDSHSDSNLIDRSDELVKPEIPIQLCHVTEKLENSTEEP